LNLKWGDAAYRVVQVMEKGKAPNVERQSPNLLYDLGQHLASVATDILGLYGQLWKESEYAPLIGMAPHSFLASKGIVCRREPMRFERIVAARGLGMPAIT